MATKGQWKFEPDDRNRWVLYQWGYGDEPCPVCGRVKDFGRDTCPVCGKPWEE